MTTLIIIRATINSRKGPSIPCDMYFDLNSLEDNHSMAMRHAVIQCAIETWNRDYQELECQIQNDTGLDVTVKKITVKQTPEEE